MKIVVLGMALASAVISFTGTTYGQEPGNRGEDPLRSLVPPDALIQHRQQLELSDEQVEAIQKLTQELQSEIKPREEQLKEAVSELGKVVSKEPVDEEAALKQLDRVLAAEKEIKHLHLRILIRARNKLTTEQVEKIRRHLQGDAASKELEKRLTSKVATIEKEVQARAQNGQPPEEVVRMMQEFPELMERGQVEKAEALLDRVLKMLGQEPSERERK